MRTLFAILFLCFCALVWAYLSIARSLRAARTSNGYASIPALASNHRAPPRLPSARHYPSHVLAQLSGNS